MGYRSDIQIAFYLTQGTDNDTTEVSPILSFPALKLWFEETYPIKEAKDEWCATIDYGEDYILLTYRDVKWYDGYEHPNNVRTAFEAFSNAFRSDERDHRAQYEFVRVGEDADDIETDRSSYADHRLGVERNIIFE